MILLCVSVINYLFSNHPFCQVDSHPCHQCLDTFWPVLCCGLLLSYCVPLGTCRHMLLKFSYVRPCPPMLLPCQAYTCASLPLSAHLVCLTYVGTIDSGHYHSWVVNSLQHVQSLAETLGMLYGPSRFGSSFSPFFFLVKSFISTLIPTWYEPGLLCFLS